MFVNHYLDWLFVLSIFIELICFVILARINLKYILTKNYKELPKPMAWVSLCLCLIEVGLATVILIILVPVVIP